jgi:hypothetical protein
MRIKGMEDAQGSYGHEEEIRGLHTNMGNAETESNERRDRKDHVTMRILQKEVQSYKADNEKIMKAKKEILQSLICYRIKLTRIHKQGKKPMPRKGRCLGLMIGGMIMEDLDDQGVLASIGIIIIPRGVDILHIQLVVTILLSLLQLFSTLIAYIRSLKERQSHKQDR